MLHFLEDLDPPSREVRTNLAECGGDQGFLFVIIGVVRANRRARAGRATDEAEGNSRGQ